ncbi:hypothetical protein HDU67_004439 [Dinochytrium kinnereticum]|nr:hypothetical protein HDU67_004439 [Dinochytrium kinnereticum]
MAKRQPRSAKVFPVHPGMKGILASCTLNKDKLATKEMMSLLSEYADMWYGEEGLASAGDADDDEEAEKSIEEAFAKEMQGLKGPSKKKRFHWLDIGIDCCFFIKVENPIVPVDFVLRILSDLNETKKKKTRYTLRIVPLAEICSANVESIVTLAKKLLPEHFHKENQEPLKWSIVFNRRNSNKINRDELISAIAAIVGDKHTVDLVNPEVVVLVEAFRGVCGVSVLHDFYRLKKFNFETIFDEENATRSHQMPKSGPGSGRSKAKERHAEHKSRALQKESTPNPYDEV